MPKVLALFALSGLAGAFGGAALHLTLEHQESLASIEHAGTVAAPSPTGTASVPPSGETPYARRVRSAIGATDMLAALAALETIDDPAVVRAAALELVAALGDTRDAIERVAIHMRPGARLGFRADAYARWAERNASAAVAAALAASDDPAMQWTLLQRIALALAQTSPDTAWLTAAGIPNAELRRDFRAALLAEWALVDPDATLDFLEHVNPAELPGDLEGHDLLIAADPERLLALTARFPARVSVNTRRTALATLAARDPERALEHWRSLAPETERDSLLVTVARGYGVNDPRAAFAWAEAQPSSTSLLPAVLNGIASVDFEHALGLIADGARANRDDAFAWAANVMQNGLSSDEAQRLLDALSTNAYPESAYRVNSALYQWARTDARSAVDWLVAHVDEVPVDIVGSVADIVARADAELAMSVAGRLPAERRGDWVQNVVSTVASRDSARALALLEPYRGEPFYDSAVRGIAGRTASYDPETAAQVLTDAHLSATVALAGIARSWAARDPAAAAAWVLRLPSEDARRSALRPVAQQWARQDLERGIAWALGVPRADRDAALTGLVEGAAQIGAVDERIFASFYSHEAKLAAVERAVIFLGGRYPERARRLVDTLVTDAARKEQLESVLAQALIGRFTP